MAESQDLLEIQLASETNNQPKQKHIITFMDRKWYNAAAEGRINQFKDYTEPLDLLRTANKNTVLHVHITAAKKETEESIELVKLVISKCSSLLAEPNIKGETPLHIAARFGHKNIVECLIDNIKKAQHEDLERGAEASISDKMLKTTSPDEDTALHEAVRNNHPQVVETLIRENPEFANIANAAGESPLYLAAVRENNSMASKILEICPSPAYIGPKGRTALHEAVISKDKDLTRKIRDKNNSLTKEQDKKGWTPLHYASYFNLIPIVEMLLADDNKSAAYIGDNHERTPLHIAIICGKSHLKVMKKIMSDCPDCCELTDNRGRNILHFAVESGSFKGVQIITEEPSLANLINQKDKEGNTPVHLVAAFGFEECSLTEHHLVDKKAVNNKNLTALDVVLERKDESDEPLGFTARGLRRVGYKRGRP
ncbi:protein ACCELERATED CELL DEATH 6-like [Hevea brasiliensis]|uniref:protein ACCELERATED CELL DEATH 6-like n=1 Tax=Hevea brasiliensis TaxID=3981 RepID=UPI0025F46E1C|nr:protein ACCELERATED CELL DEATH 6-like [Hevea brasiliensis]